MDELVQNIIFNCMGKRKVKYHNGFRFLPAKRQFAQENANLNVILFCTLKCRTICKAREIKKQ